MFTAAEIKQKLLDSIARNLKIIERQKAIIDQKPIGSLERAYISGYLFGSRRATLTMQSYVLSLPVT